MINLPLASRIAFRGSAFYQRDAGFIDNVFGSRTYCGAAIRDPVTDKIIGCVHNGISVNNSAFLKKDINETTTYGGRAALKIDLDDNWTVTPTVMHQYSKTDGFIAFDPSLGDLNVQRFRGDEFRKDQFTQAADDRRQDLGLRPDLRRCLYGPPDLFARRLYRLFRCL